MRILLAEDERPLSRAIVKILEKNNCSVDAVYDGCDALEYIRAGNYDVCVLDVMMPRLDGFSVIRQLRLEGNFIPILILSAKAEVDDRVTGLDSGANYYLTKPFDAKELLATLRTITRGSGNTSSILSFGNVTLDRASFLLSTPQGSYKLANKEFQMMEMLISNPGKVVSTERFLEKIWGWDTDTEISVVWVYVSYLRKKLSALEANVVIKASRNAGYALEEAK